MGYGKHDLKKIVGPRIKTSVFMDISVVGFYEYTRIYRKISVEILTKKSMEEILRKKNDKTRNNTHIQVITFKFYIYIISNI